jgi:protein PhnA
MDNELKCPECNSEHVYHDGSLWICPECAHEWNPQIAAGDSSAEASQEQGVRDAHGNVLNDGDSVTVIKDLTWIMHEARSRRTGITENQ